MTDPVSGVVQAALQNYRIGDAVFEAYEVPAEDVVAGDPKIEVATLYEAEDGSVIVGVARLSGGTVRYSQTADEIDYVLAGHIIIEADLDDLSIEATAGTVTRLSKGVTYTKTIVEPYEELFVMFNEDSDAVPL
jgi:uncharacterized cupin superfamily protein